MAELLGQKSMLFIIEEFKNKFDVYFVFYLQNQDTNILAVAWK